MLSLLLVGLLTAPGVDLTGGDAAFTHPRPVRLKRPLMLGAEIGVNGLTGFGPSVSYTFNGAWSLDAAAGISAQLGRGGVRARYTFLPSDVAPFAAVGAMYALGTPYDLKGFGQDKEVVYHIAGAPFAQAVVGVLYNHRKGFSLMGSIGWAQLLTRGSNVVVEQGELSKSQLRGIRWAAGSGPVLSLNVGYSL